MLLLIAIFITITYLIIIGLLTYGFDKVKDFKLQNLESKTKFSVVIPFRNEAENLPDLLTSISNLNYPKSLFEIILVNDDSNDESVLIIEKILASNSTIDNIRIIKNERTSNSPKKDAITSAIKVSNYNWIVTTDADCVLPQYWLDTFDESIQTEKPNCIVAPVTYHGENSFLNRFQTLDFLSLQGATIGGFGIDKAFMCNGANFAYKKSEFKSVKGFEGNDGIASGDDMFLLEKFIKHDSKKVSYLKAKTAIVTTNPAENLKNLVHQRIRWASKASRYNFWFSKLVGLIVLLGNLVFLGLIISLIFNYSSSQTIIALLVIKFSIDFLLLFKTTRFFRQDNLLLSYLFSIILYPIFNVSVAFLSFFKTYEWKGRNFKK
ncbi:glycosyltransferase [Winogradskyella undariae]|uniref:glycosyltransferase family 2 protein n=1 Tax=Winogradskyella undariae TaxID=1285465 RepID=UPI00156AADED|nr:glycosyltransferase [Winogradskyella undariae]NRR90088.1 glycosyltransferase [Winogradskyella undariae]